MKLNEVSCPACLRATPKDNLICRECGFVRKCTQAEVWDQRWRMLSEQVAPIHATYPVGTPRGDDGPSKLVH